MTTDLIMRVNVRTTTTSFGFTDKFVTANGCRGIVSTTGMIFGVRTTDDATYYVVFRVLRFGCLVQ